MATGESSLAQKTDNDDRNNFRRSYEKLLRDHNIHKSLVENQGLDADEADRTLNENGQTVDGNKIKCLDIGIIKSSIELLLRRHHIRNKICPYCPSCSVKEKPKSPNEGKVKGNPQSPNDEKIPNDDVNSLKVAAVDQEGLVTQVECMQCGNYIPTVCYKAGWSYEKIADERKLKVGDHICWHKMGYWHHAIVEMAGSPATNAKPRLIQYSNKLEVSRSAEPSCCDCDCIHYPLYRVNYEDCYTPEYTVLRAKQLLEEKRYNLFERNCEHFSCWCKTGLTDSSQVQTVRAGVAKIAAAIMARVVALVILGLLQLSTESQEDNVRNRALLEQYEKRLTIAYVVIIAVVFTLYQLRYKGAHLMPVSRKKKSGKDERCCNLADLYECCVIRDAGGRHPEDRCECEWCCCCCCCPWCWKCCCCLTCSFVTAAVRSLLAILRPLKHISCCPLLCCKRPGWLAMGLFIRVVMRESISAVGTILVVIFEDEIPFDPYVYSPAGRTACLMILAAGCHFGGYALGVLLGRLLECGCDSCKADYKIQEITEEATARR